MGAVFIPDVIQSIAVVVGVVAGLWLMIAAAGAFPVLLLWYSNFEYVDNSKPTISRAVKAMGKEWLIEAGFRPDGAIAPLGVKMALFRHRSEHTALGVYFVGGKVITDMITTFPNDVHFTTANTIDGVAAPLTPGGIIQCLPSSTLSQRWKQHIDGARLLRDELNVSAEPMGDLSEEYANATSRQARNLFTRPWLILTLPYRYFVTRFRYRNVTIKQQLEKGWLNVQRLSEQARFPVD